MTISTTTHNLKRTEDQRLVRFTLSNLKLSRNLIIIVLFTLICSSCSKEKVSSNEVGTSATTENGDIVEVATSEVEETTYEVFSVESKITKVEAKESSSARDLIDNLSEEDRKKIPSFSQEWNPAE